MAILYHLSQQQGLSGTDPFRNIEGLVKVISGVGVFLQHLPDNLLVQTAILDHTAQLWNGLRILWAGIDDAEMVVYIDDRALENLAGSLHNAVETGLFHSGRQNPVCFQKPVGWHFLIGGHGTPPFLYFSLFYETHPETATDICKIKQKQW